MRGEEALVVGWAGEGLFATGLGDCMSALGRKEIARSWEERTGSNVGRWAVVIVRGCELRATVRDVDDRERDRGSCVWRLVRLDVLWISLP